MKSFSNAFAGECYKIFRKGKIFILLGVLVALALLLTFSYQILLDFGGAFDININIETIDM